MQDEHIKLNIKNALQGLVDREKGALHAIYDKSDEDARARAEKLRPVFEALLILKEEIGDIANISVATAGHMATIDLKSNSGSNRMVISTTFGSVPNSHFTIEHETYFSWTSDFSEKEHRFVTADETLEYVMAEVAKVMASEQVLSERKKQ
jgi:hypothetical protein